MPTVNSSVDVAAAPEKVWSVLSDPQRFGDWLTLHDGWVDEPPAQIGVGSRLHEQISLMGMVNRVDWTVDEFEAPKGLAISGTAIAGVKITFRLGVTPTGSGSTVGIDADFAGQMIVGPIGAAVEKEAKKAIDQSLANLAEKL